MDESQLRRQFKKALEQYERRLDRFPALLGDGRGNVEVSGRPGYVYCRVGNAETQAEVFNQRVILREDLPVIVGYAPEQPGLFQVLCQREVYMGGGQGNALIPQVIPHHQIHELRNTAGGDDVVWVHSQQITALLTCPTNPVSMQVQVKSGIFAWELTWQYYLGGTSDDLSSYVPALEADSIAVLVSIDCETVTLQYTAGDTFPTAWPPTDFDEKFPTPPAGSVPSGIVVLAGGTASIGWDELWDARLFGQPVGGSVMALPSHSAYVEAEMDFLMTRHIVNGE